MRRGLATAAVLVLCVACGSTSLLKASPSPAPGPVLEAMCFNAPPADWAAAISKTIANLPGNFGLIAVDDFNQIAYGDLQTSSGEGIWGVDLQSGHTFLVAQLTPSESGVIWASTWSDWLVWAQGESKEVMGAWTIQAWNGKSRELIQLASSQLPSGGYLQGELVFPIVGHGYVAWNQPSSTSSGDLRVFNLATRKVTNLDSGIVSSPVFAGNYLVWAKVNASESAESLRFVDANTLKSVGAPHELARPVHANYLAGSDEWLLWISTAPTADRYRLTVDHLAAGHLALYASDETHFLQFPMIAGYFMIWYGPAGNSVADLRTGAAIDVSGNGTVAGAGDTIVVAKVAPPPTKGAITSTSLSVLHTSRLSDLGTCTG